MGSVLSGITGTQNKYSGSPNAPGQSEQQTAEQYQELLNRRNQLFAGQSTLAQALQQQMAGQGPNPAQLQYQGNVQNNIANAQGLIASQRGLNPALAARMGANAASQANQQAALGSALLQQQQQLAATQNLGNLYGQQQQGLLGYMGQQQQNQQAANQLAYGIAGQNQQMAGALVGGAAGGLGGGASWLANRPGGSSGGGGGTAMAGGPMDAGSMQSAAMVAAHGGYVKGGQIHESGDSESNDTVPTMLSPGEIVIPRSKAHDPEKAKEFIDQLLKHEGKSKKSDGSDYGEVLKARRKRASK